MTHSCGHVKSEFEHYHAKTEKIASCKFIGDDLHLRGGLLGEPQLFPLLVEFNHF
jgi:hypothetical protein